MARIRETKNDFRVEGQHCNAGVAYDCESFYVFVNDAGSSDDITPKQARRLAKWLNDRCDEIERQANE